MPTVKEKLEFLQDPIRSCMVVDGKPNPDYQRIREERIEFEESVQLKAYCKVCKQVQDLEILLLKAKQDRDKHQSIVEDLERQLSVVSYAADCLGSAQVS